MSREKHDSSEPRDTTFARLVAGALQARSAAAADAACPDAGVLAAYAERALQPDEAAHWESHFADCARCQTVLAVLAANAEDPLTQQEVSRLGSLAGKTAAPADRPAPAPPVVTPQKHWALWQWLVPAFGIAAAALLWVTLHPAARQRSLSAERFAPPPPAQLQPSPQPSAAQPSATPPPAANAAPRLATPYAPESQSLPRQAAPLSEQRTQQTDELRDAEKLPSPPSAPAPAPALQAAPAASAPEPEPRSTTQSVTVTEATPQAGTGSGVAGAPVAGAPAARAPAAASPAQPELQAQADAADAAASDSRIASLAQPQSPRSFAAMAKVARLPAIFATAARTVEWRVGANGSIERSTDQGATWQRQPSGVTADLLSGVAVSDKIAWIVGRAGVILRTTDGERWQRASAPPATPVAGRLDVPTQPPDSRDWTTVAATDAFHAQVTSATGARFTTADGGQTWSALP